MSELAKRKCVPCEGGVPPLGPDEYAPLFEQLQNGWKVVDESQLRATRVAQVWRSKDGDWQLTREKRVAGDLGLFGEHVEVVHPEIRDVQYPTTTLR